MSTNATSNMVESLLNSNRTEDPIAFDKVGTNLLHLAGYLVDGTAAKNDNDEEENEDDEVRQQEQVNRTHSRVTMLTFLNRILMYRMLQLLYFLCHSSDQTLNLWPTKDAGYIS